jgi:hypothetical protein
MIAEPEETDFCGLYFKNNEVLQGYLIPKKAISVHLQQKEFFTERGGWSNKLLGKSLFRKREDAFVDIHMISLFGVRQFLAVDHFGP